MLKKMLLVLAISAFAAMAVTGCNTTRGAGEDIENLGEEMQETTDELR